ncbi:hypothetical protein [Hansschlegelia quercus]
MTMSHAATPERGDLWALSEGAGIVVLIWAIFALASAVPEFSSVVEKMSTDDAMRLVEVRDWLGGQGWFDLTQRRLNPPDGVIMHWSRLIDLPIALLLKLFGLAMPGDRALAATLTLWPLILLLPALLAVASASRTLAGDRAGAIGALLLVASPAVTRCFAPGALDHHGAQIALALILLACALKLERSKKAAIGAGCAAAAMTGIGMETAPHVAVCATMIALRWALVGEGLARGAALFGATFAGGTVVVALTTLSVESWLARVCDTLGAGHLAIAIVGGLGLALATRLGGESRASRLFALAQVGLATGAALWLVAPNCLSSPYAMLPERLRSDWLAKVEEAQPFFVLTRDAPTMALAIGTPLLVSLGVAIWAVATASREVFWAVATACAMFAAALAVTAWQSRGMGLAFAMAGPLLPMGALAFGRGGMPRVLAAVVALSPVALALLGLGVATLAGLPPIDGKRVASSCPSRDYASLDALPAGLALNTVDTGPFILAFSRLSAVAAPYHRNVAGISDALDAFEGSEEAARAVTVSRRAAYVVVCPLDAGVTPAAKRHPDGFAAALLSSTPPAWLAPVELAPDAKLRAFRVLAGAPQ